MKPVNKLLMDRKNAELNGVVCKRCKLRNEAQTPFCKKCKFDLAYGTLNKPKRGKCWFCGKFRDLSDEHFVPQWVINEFSLAGSGAHTITRPETVFGPQLNAHIIAPGKMSGKIPLQYKVPTVCVACNTGWMSKLQTEVRPIVTPILNGERVELNAVNAKLVSRWIAVAICSLEYINGIKFISQGQRTSLMRGVMPKNLVVYVGESENYRFGHHIRPLTIHRGGSVSNTITSAFLVIADSVFYVGFINGVAPKNLMEQVCGHVLSRAGFASIWPSQTESYRDGLPIDQLSVLDVLQATITAVLGKQFNTANYDAPPVPSDSNWSPQLWKMTIDSIVSDFCVVK